MPYGSPSQPRTAHRDGRADVTNWSRQQPSYVEALASTLLRVARGDGIFRSGDSGGFIAPAPDDDGHVDEHGAVSSHMWSARAAVEHARAAHANALALGTIDMGARAKGRAAPSWAAVRTTIARAVGSALASARAQHACAAPRPRADRWANNDSAMATSRARYELLGADVIFDEDGRATLLELQAGQLCVVYVFPLY